MPKTLSTSGVIRRLVDRGDVLLVSLPQHDGYFKAGDPAIIEKIYQAHQASKPIAFDYDQELTIITLRMA